MPMVTRSKAKAIKTGPKRQKHTRKASRSQKKASKPVSRPEKPNRPARQDGRSRSPEENQLQLAEDPIIAYKRNLDSALYQLPKELILKIMSHLTPGGLFLARQSCRLFMQLFDGPEFDGLRNHHLGIGLLKNRGVDWQNIKFDERREVRAIFHRSGYCKPCQSTMAWGRRETRARIKAQSRQAFYCSGCKRDHPGILFSVEQRKARVSDGKRICIGREGYVRLCKHKTISWLDVERVLNHGDKSTPYEETIECRSQEHCPRNSGEDRSPKLDHGRSMYPRVKLERCCGNVSSDGTPKINFSLEWTVLPLATQADQQTTLPQLQREMSSYQRTAPPISPCNHETFSEPRFLRAFDPNLCACLGFGLPVRHPPTECPGRGWRCCMCKSIEDGHSKAGLLLATKWHPTLPAHFSNCPDCDTSYEWERTGDAVMLSRQSTAWAKDPFDYSWIQLLDFDSYNLETGRDKHYRWCYDPSCQTSRRWRNRVDVRRECIALLGAWKSPREVALAKRRAASAG